MPAPLPIDPLLPELVSALARNTAAVVLAPPGAGKTTRIPPALARAGWLEGTQQRGIVLLQPRRIAARAAAARIADEQSWRLGREVGYHIRFENRTSPETRVRVLTEGILTRQIQSDPFLEGVGCVILDEFHERSIHTDLALALLREVQQTVREDLRIVVMSATMNPAPVASFLGGVPILESPGRLFPVGIDYLPRPDSSPPWEKAAASVRRALADSPAGHVLVFLPGMGEIRRTEALLRDCSAQLHILHSSISNEEQDRALRPTTARKLILATNIAETSLTIEGVQTVVDTGLVRVLVNDTRLGIDRLELRRISKASAAQRAGRAGRTAPGRCYRLWTEAEQSALEEHGTPEISLIDLASTVLTLRAYGVRNLQGFAWFEAPRPDNLQRAERFLELLGAVQPDGSLTPVGKRLATLPLHPRLGRLLLAGAEAGLLQEAATLAALLSEKDILTAGPGGKAQQAGWESESDLLDRLAAFEGFRGSSSVDPQALRTVERVREQLLALGKELEGHPGSRAGHQDRNTRIREMLLLAYPDRVTLRRANDPSRGVMVGGRGVVLEPSSVVRKAPLFLSIDPRDSLGTGVGESRVSLASAIAEEWLGAAFPHLLERRLHSRFDPERERVLTFEQTLFAGLVIRETGTRNERNSEGVAEALFEFLRRDLSRTFEDDEGPSLWLRRVRLLHRHMPELDLPDFSPGLLDECLREACAGESDPDGVRGAPLVAALESRLTWAQRSALDQHAPKSLEVPSGNRIRLQYPADSAPVLAARIQELFGLPESPRVAGGRVSVLLHLLGPNYRPVQVTSDLRNFWNTTYAEVRKELRARYPKHPWPEDPWNAPAVSIGGRRRG